MFLQRKKNYFKISHKEFRLKTFNNTSPIGDKNVYLVGTNGFTYFEQLYRKADAKCCGITMSSEIEY